MKAWQAITLVGFVLIAVVFVFDDGGQPVGVDSAMQAAEQSATERAVDGDESEPGSAEPSPNSQNIDGWAADSASGFADVETANYGAPQAPPVPSSTVSPWSKQAQSQGQSVSPAQPQGQSRAPRRNPDLPQGPPPPGARDPSKAPPRIIPIAPSDDPNLQADVREALARSQG